MSDKIWIPKFEIFPFPKIKCFFKKVNFWHLRMVDLTEPSLERARTPSIFDDQFRLSWIVFNPKNPIDLEINVEC